MYRGKNNSIRNGRQIEWHGMYGTPTYSTWQAMLARCYWSGHKRYGRYGGRGIKVCDRWRDSFVNFYKDMGDKPLGTSLDRIDNNGDYSSENCRWATPREQSLNNSRNVFLTHNNLTMTQSQWADMLGISRSTLCSRLKKGLSLDEAFRKAG